MIDAPGPIGDRDPDDDPEAAPRRLRWMSGRRARRRRDLTENSEREQGVAGGQATPSAWFDAPTGSAEPPAASPPAGAQGDERAVSAGAQSTPAAVSGRAQGDGPAVSASAITRRFGAGEAAVEALRDVSVSFSMATFSAIMGPSGSGKSTLMHILAGLDQPTEGVVEIAGQRLDDLNDASLTRLRREQVGFVFQAFNLLPMLSAEENVLLPLRIAGHHADPEWLETVVEAVGLTERRDHRPAELSGGQQQRTALGRALITRPAVIFADEPTGNLDTQASDEVLDLLRRCVEEFDQTIVMVSHDPLAAERADRVLFLRDGRLIRDTPRLGRREILDVLTAS